jgi:dephospho-CoA kinase
MNKVIFGLVGQMASGKDTVKLYLEDNYAAKSCRFSNILRSILDILGMENSRTNLQELSTNLRTFYGEDILAKTIVSQVNKIDSQVVVVDGVRRLADIKYLKELNNFFLISIEADLKIRYERLIKRGENENDDQKSFEEFVADHQKEAELQIEGVIKKADYKLDNNQDFNYLYQQIDKIIKDWQNK